MHHLIGGRSMYVPSDMVPRISRKFRAGERRLDPFMRVPIPHVPKTGCVRTLGTEHVLGGHDKLEHIELKGGEIRRRAAHPKIEIPSEMTCCTVGAELVRIKP